MESVQQRLVELWARRVSNTLTEAEAVELLQLLQQADAEQTLSPVLYEHWKELTAQHTGTALSAGQIDQFMERLPVAGETRRGRLRFMRHWWAAAAVVLMLGAWLWLGTGRRVEPPVTREEDKHTEIMPGKDGAVLTLADGSQVLLDTVRNGTVARQGNVAVKVIDGRLLYEGNAATALYNTIHTPRGRKYQLILPDGTLVWLNAASSIRYPTLFVNNERRVEVTGEVYMEVAPLRLRSGQKAPFKVNVNDKAEVEVLGTHFNINAYDDEENIKTTLFEGKVKVSQSAFARASADKSAIGNKQSAKNAEPSVVLKPGEQAELSRAHSPLTTDHSPLTIHHSPNLEQVIAWKNDLFNFEGASLEEAMRRLERWYDIRVSYENGVPDVKLRGEMTQGVKLNELLIALEQLGLHFKLEGRKLHILQ